MGPNQGNPEVAAQAASGSSNSYMSCSGISSITSGGGFSTYFTQPSYQKSAVSRYLALKSLTTAYGYNPNGRAYPDLSFLATNYEVYVGGSVELLDGTSASAPLAAALSKNVLGIILSLQRQFHFHNFFSYTNQF